MTMTVNGCTLPDWLMKKHTSSLNTGVMRSRKSLASSTITGSSVNSSRIWRVYRKRRIRSKVLRTNKRISVMFQMKTYCHSCVITGSTANHDQASASFDLLQMFWQTTENNCAKNTCSYYHYSKVSMWCFEKQRDVLYLCYCRNRFFLSWYWRPIQAAQRFPSAWMPWSYLMI